MSEDSKNDNHFETGLLDKVKDLTKELKDSFELLRDSDCDTERIVEALTDVSLVVNAEITHLLPVVARRSENSREKGG